MNLAFQAVVFESGSTEFAIDIQLVRQILRPRDVRPVPRAPDFLSGVFAWQGEIVPLIDLPKRLALPASPLTGRTRFLVVTDGDELGALRVDNVKEILDVPEESVEPPPESFAGVRGDFISGICRIETRTLPLLHLPRVLARKEAIR
jgi:purine-binding chemotaxis protein CheW